MDPAGELPVGAIISAAKPLSTTTGGPNGSAAAILILLLN